MVFDSFAFAAFFGVLFPLYLLCDHKRQNLLLLAASYFFYGFWSWKFLLLLIATNVVDFWCGIGLEHTENPRLRKLIVATTVVANMSALCFFKYFNFFAANLQTLFGHFGLTIPEFALEVILPYGISFYTFQEMTYVFDVYRRDVRAARKFTDFSLFVTFFPHLVAGPIMRAAKLLPQVLEPRVVTISKVSEGCWLFLWGLYKKVFVADNLALLVDPVYQNPGAYSGPQIAVATYAFAFQIYGDFSGYSDMARGLGRILGFDIIWNFNLPYFSASPSEFWRRWHISLSTWLRDNLYIPLGGNRKGRGREITNLMVTMTLGGLWHGARWNFILWGVYQGLLLVAERVWRLMRGDAPDKCSPMRRAFAIFVMFQFVCVGWLLFRAERALDIQRLLIGLLHGWDQLYRVVPMLKLLVQFAGLLVVLETVMYITSNRYVMQRWPVVVRFALYVILYLCISMGGPQSGRLFIYFQF
ncbi:MAG: MBOAT family O-acyltransferase [Candidatus Sumerlaeaceae bacterium]